ncbi:1,4-dihydroxy-2-naphthoate octaprenyltransferase [Candidatus Calditenuaceae archaeon HR02]|nr:1,4-dihydroxy-2-naphthoate octaprenyltransferase [Candidatus Calditenuaceae archaeon HR02]
MSFVSATLAAVLAIKLAAFDASLYLLTLAGLILLHAATNMLNDYFDVKNREDRFDVPTSRYRPHPLLTGEVGGREFLTMTVTLYGLVVLIAGVLSLVRGPLILLLTGAGLLASVFYTAPPIAFKYRALGEPVVFLVWGPLMVGGSYYTITGTFTVEPLLASIPIGILVLLVLLANNMRDADYDREVVTTTIPILLGVRRSLILYGALLASTYVITILLILMRILSVYSLAVLFTTTIAARLVRTFWAGVPDDADPQTAKLTLLFGLLLIAGELFSIFTKY